MTASELVVRPVAPSDREGFETGFARLSPQTRFLRFGAAKPRLSRRELDWLVLVDHHDHEALLAFTPAGEPVGVGRFVRVDDAPATAEIAVTVFDAWQGRGAGTELVRRLAARAREEGVETLRAEVLPGNAAAIAVLRREGFTRAGTHGGLARFERAVSR